MLQTIRDKTAGWIAGIFLGAITIVFVFWGIDFQSGADSFAATAFASPRPSACKAVRRRGLKLGR